MNPQETVSTVLRAAVVIVVAVVAIMLIVHAGLVLDAGSKQVDYPGLSPNVMDSRISGVPGSVDVDATREYALYLNGSSAVESIGPSNVTNGSWSVCAYNSFNGTQNATYDLVAASNESLLLQYDAGNWRVTYNNSTHSGTATVTASNPGEFDATCARYNETSNELWAYRAGNYSDPVALTPGVVSRNASWTYVGKVDEVRVYGNSVPNATLAAYQNDPVQPLPDQDRLARFMFDEGSGTSSYVYFADVSASVPDSWVTGAPNPSTWLGDAISRGDDFEVSSNPFSVAVVDGGYLDGAPVMYVSWTGAGSLGFDLTGVVAALVGVLVLLRVAREIVI